MMEYQVAEISDASKDDARRLAFIREETRFEIGLLHERVNALIGAEAFLTIAFTAAMGNGNARWGATFSAVVAPVLSILGLLLAVLAWPGVDASFRIILEWNARQMELMQDLPALTDEMWRPAVLGRDKRRADPDQRKSMIFARAVPAVFVLTWAILTVVAVVLPLWR